MFHHRNLQVLQVTQWTLEPLTCILACEVCKNWRMKNLQKLSRRMWKWTPRWSREHLVSVVVGWQGSYVDGFLSHMARRLSDLFGIFKLSWFFYNAFEDWHQRHIPFAQADWARSQGISPVCLVPLCLRGQPSVTCEPESAEIGRDCHWQAGEARGPKRSKSYKTWTPWFYPASSKHEDLQRRLEQQWSSPIFKVSLHQLHMLKLQLQSAEAEMLATTHS